MDIKIYFFTYLTFMAGKVRACSTPYSYAQITRNPTSQLALGKEENFTLILKGSSPPKCQIVILKFQGHI